VAKTDEQLKEELAELQAERERLFAELQQTESQIDALTDS